MSTELASIIIPTISSITVFIIGIIIERYREKREEKEELLKYKMTITIWIELIKKPIDKQITNIKQLAQNILESKDFHPESFQTSKSMSDKINDLSVERILSTFVVHKNGYIEDDARNAFNIVSQFDFLTSSEKMAFQRYQEYNLQCRSLMNRWNEDWESFRKIMDTDESNEGKEVRFAKKMYQKWSDKTYKNNLDILETRRVLLIPLFNMLSERQSSCSKLIINQLKSLYLTVFEWEQMKNGYHKVFSDIAEYMEQSYSILHLAKEHFK